MAVTCLAKIPLTEVNLPVEEHWCYTQSTIVKYRYTWTIENFSFFGQSLDRGDFKSSTFPVGANDQVKWFLGVKYVVDNRNKYYLKLYLQLESWNNPVVAKYKFSILNAKHVETNVLEAGPTSVVAGVSYSYDFIERSVLLDKSKGLLLEDKLTIVCEVRLIKDSINIFGDGSVVQFKVPECNLLDNFGNLFDSEKFSDVTLVVGEKVIQAHQAILAARSPVFAAMFEHEMEEKKLSRVTITDIDYEVLKEILRFIYTGKVTNLEKMAHNLLTAADKYALDKLKVMCEETLCNNISVETAAEILILADLHNANQLKTGAIDFINIRSRNVGETIGWKNMILSYPHLITELLIRAQQNPLIGSQDV